MSAENAVRGAGVGMVTFSTPGRGACYDAMAAAVREALADAGLDHGSLQQAYAVPVYAVSCAGQKALTERGMTGIPITDATNNCATGSTALRRSQTRPRA